MKRGAKFEPPGRLTSMDAYRGFVMLLMASEGLRIAEVAHAFPQSPVWQFLAYQVDHVEWVGCSPVGPDPAILHLHGRRGAGVLLRHPQGARPELGSDAAPRHRPVGGAGAPRRLPPVGGAAADLLHLRGRAHARSASATPLPFCSPGRGPARRCSRPAAPAGRLLGWRSPLPAAARRLRLRPGRRAAGVAPPQGFAAHWDKNTNLAAAFDQWFLNLFPRERPFVFNGGGYLTLSFIPSLATMMLGLLAGGLMRGGRPAQTSFASLLARGPAGHPGGIGVGLAGHLPRREADLDAVMDPVQRRLGLAVAGRLLRRH